MSQIRFQSYQLDDQALILHGANYQGRLSALDQGLWRLMVYHRPEDRGKQSWVMPSQPQPVPFELSESKNGLLLKSETGELRLQIAPLGLDWCGLATFGFQSEPVKSLFQQLPQVETEPHEFLGHPVRDKLDGLPQGSGMTLNLALLPGDDFYGLGERTGFLNKRGRRWNNWATDQFFHLPQADPLYQSHPFVILRSNDAYLGLYLDESWFSCFDLGYTQPDQWSIHTAGPTLDLYLIPGPEPKDILSRYTELLGRAPMPPLWALGKHQCRWSYPEQDVVLEVARQYREHQLPLDAIWLDIDYMESYKVFSFSTFRFPDPGQMCLDLMGMGIRTVAIVDPGVKCEPGYHIYDQGKELKAWVQNYKDEDLVGAVWPEPVVWPDFSQPAVRRWWGQNHRFYLEKGLSGIWNDMNEPAAFKWVGKTLPLDARQGVFSHAEVHNLYAYQMCQATYEGLLQLQHDKRPFILTRSGFAGIQKYAWVWTGDNASYWEHLEMSIPMLLNLGLSGVPFIGADIGGFSGDCDGELLSAWTWLGVCYPFMRNHAGKRSRRQEPWQFGEPWSGYVRQAVEFRYRLLPYLYTLARQATLDGLPLMRPLLLEYPDDAETRNLNDEFLLGTDLLAAPVTRPGQTRRLIYLPAGDWVDFWNGEVHKGQQWRQISVSPARLPLYQRAGSALPLAPLQQHTTSAEWPELTWRIAPAAAMTGQVYSDAGDGPVNGQIETISGTLRRGKLHLQRSESSRKVKLALTGCPGIEGAVQDETGCWVIDMPEAEIELKFPGG
ncbi:MAG: glycoside hydrolase family 31 protein [Candidatus Sericytochromatia bacterium]